MTTPQAPSAPPSAAGAASHQNGLDVASRLQALRQKNLAFFQQRYPKIHQAFSAYKLRNIKLNIDGDTGEVDIIVDGKLLYDGHPRAAAEREINLFKHVFSEGKTFNTVSHARAGTYTQPRFFHQRAAAIVNKSPAATTPHTGYVLEDFYPMITFFGIGAGYHIEEFLLSHDVQHVIIMEADLDYFAASLYTIDWERLHEGYSPQNGRSLELLIGNLQKDDNIFALTWNNLIHYCPLFPASTFLYNHRANPKYVPTIDKICTDLNVMLTVFGYYDDEVNQLNNALHNFHKKIRNIPAAATNSHQFKPVCIIGAGPSLDDRIELLRRHRDQLTLISCGTGLRSLYHHGLKPDFHVEVESHIITVEHLQNAAPAEWLRDIPFIGAAQVNPYVFKLFDERRLYFKAESSLGKLFGSAAVNIADGNPTCTNAAAALAAHHQAPAIYLFGLDFGYHDRARHHAQGSLYLDENAPERFKGGNKSYQNASMFEVDAAAGGTIKTTPIFYHSKRKVEKVILQTPGSQFYNCSDGVLIEGAAHLPLTELDAHFATLEVAADAPNLKDHLFGKQAELIKTASIKSHIRRLKESLQFLEHMIGKELDRLQPNLKDLSLTVFRINYIVEHELTRRFDESYHFIRGTFWHFTFIGYTNAFVIKDPVQRAAFIEAWRTDFRSLIRDIQPHFSSVVDKSYKKLKDDPWLPIALGDPEPGLRPLE